MDTPTNIRTSIIIVTWNTARFIEPCLAALLSQIDETTEIIVVDNASTDDSAAVVAGFAPVVRLVQNQYNRGFAGGNNVALQQARGDLVILLNPDTVVQPGWLQAIVTTFRNDTAGTIGIVGCKALYPDGKTIQHAGGQIKADGYSLHLGQGEEDKGQFDKLSDCDYVTGAAMAIHRHALDRLGLLDAGFHPGFYEETDYCWRARRAGFRVVYQPKAVLLHHESPTLADRGEWIHDSFQRNRLRFVLLHWDHAALATFLANEAETLQSDQSIPLVTARSHAYWNGLCYLAHMIRRRTQESNLGRPLSPDQSAQLKDQLYQLRTLARQRIVYLFMHTPLDALPAIEGLTPSASVPIAAQEVMTKHLPELLQQIDRSQHLAPHHFTSQVPLIGGAIAWVRTQWASVAARWLVQTLGQQQSQFNMMVAQTLKQMVTQVVPQMAAQMAASAHTNEVQYRLLAHLDRMLTTENALLLNALEKE